MSTPHALNGQELAIDRATPKEKGPAGQAQMAARMSASQQSSGYSGGSRRASALRPCASVELLGAAIAHQGLGVTRFLYVIYLTCDRPSGFS